MTKHSNQTKHLTSSVIMVKPIDFCYNEQTAVDNAFQNKPSTHDNNHIQIQAMKEFEQSVKTLNELGIETLILEKTHTQEILPDAIFPNNWFSTRADGSVIVYPMKTKNRQDEVQVSELIGLLERHHYQIANTHDFRFDFLEGSILEGTGSLIFHHPSNRLFAAISERCEQKALEKFADRFQYTLIAFNTLGADNKPIYHTNVLMSCGENFAVVTEEIINNSHSKHVRSNLEECIEDLIIISEHQMNNHFCGNILQLEDSNQQPVIALSDSAYHGFNSKQKKMLEKHGSLAICPIPTIEKVGGGSTRCMLAENFLPKSRT